MAHFTRTAPAPIVKGNYRALRPHVRRDFKRYCAYCLSHEDYAHGEESFELDHFLCKAYHPHLIRDFYNLYYACHVCNNYKRNFPTLEQMKQGLQIVDLCKENFSDHFEQLPNGAWSPKTRAAEYTIIRLRLNRSHLVKIRKRLMASTAKRSKTKGASKAS